MKSKAASGLRAVRVMAFIAAAAAQGVLAQAVDNDYYSGRGTPLLRSVEQYHLYPAEEKLRSRNYESALGDLTFLLKYFPNHPRGLMLMVQLCSEWKSGHCALDVVFEKAISVRPDEPNTFVMTGIYLQRVKKYKQAIASYERALALDPDSMNAHYNLGLAYLDTGQYKSANEHAQRAYALGAPLPGLRQRLQKIGEWNTAVAEPAAPRSGPPEETRSSLR